MLYLRGSFILKSGEVLHEKTFHSEDVFSPEIVLHLLKTGFAVSVPDSIATPASSSRALVAQGSPDIDDSESPPLKKRKRHYSTYKTRELRAK